MSNFIGIVVVVAIVVVAIVVVATIVNSILRQQKIVNELKNRADQGDAQAQYDLARRFQLEKPSEAAVYFKQAAEQGHGAAQYEMGLRCNKEIGKDGKDGKDIVQAISWFSKAAESGHANAQYELGLFLQEGKGTEQNLVLAVSWFQKAANQGHAEAQYELGVCYLRGAGVEESMSKAIDWCKKAVENGSEYAEAIVGFKEIEQIRKFNDVRTRQSMERNSLFLQQLGIELAKNGYRLSCGRKAVVKMEDGHYRVYLSISDRTGNDVGSMRVGTYGPGHEEAISDGNIRVLLHRNRQAVEALSEHIIYLDRACIVITSKVCWPEAPPEWMKACAAVLAQNWTICDPKWLERCPDAKKYVNAVFR